MTAAGVPPGHEMVYSAGTDAVINGIYKYNGKFWGALKYIMKGEWEGKKYPFTFSFVTTHGIS